MAVLRCSRLKPAWGCTFWRSSFSSGSDFFSLPPLGPIDFLGLPSCSLFSSMRSWSIAWGAWAKALSMELNSCILLPAMACVSSDQQAQALQDMRQLNSPDGNTRQGHVKGHVKGWHLPQAQQYASPCPMPEERHSMSHRILIKYRDYCEVHGRILHLLNLCPGQTLVHLLRHR